MCSGPDSLLQQVRGMVRGPLRPGQRGLGALQLRDPRQLPGEALLVPRPHLQERCRVPPLQRDQRQLPGPRVGVLAGAEVDLPAVRGQGLPLQDPARA